MNLTDGRRGDRASVKLGKQVAGTAAGKLLADPGLDIFVRSWRHHILKALELFAKLVGEKVGHDADELTDFDEKPLQADDGALDTAGVAKMFSPQ